MIFQTRKVELESKEITEKTGKLEKALKNLSEDFNDTYNNLEVNA